MIRDFRDHLADMLAYAEKARAFVGPMNAQEFRRNETVYLATTRAIEIVGEAARHIPEDFQRRFPSIPWRRIVGMRNILVHNYDGADPEIIYHTATVEMTELIALMNVVIKEADSERR